MFEISYYMKWRRIQWYDPICETKNSISLINTGLSIYIYLYSNIIDTHTHTHNYIQQAEFIERDQAGINEFWGEEKWEKGGVPWWPSG